MAHAARRISCLSAVALVAVLAACGSSSGPKSAATTAAASSASASTAATGGSTSAAPATGSAITIKSFSFKPTPLTVKVGATVTITNEDATNHTVTADDKSFDTGPFSGGSKTITLSKAGTFSYHCSIHTFMTGMIQVEA